LVLHRLTGGGIDNNSTWARGQAWGIYAFTMIYRETKDYKFLKAAQGMADYYLTQKSLPADMVTYWDFNAVEKGYKPPYKLQGQKMDLRDASAAAITASALFELSTYLDDEGAKYYKAGETILKSLSGPKYLASPGTNNNFLLMHGVGSFPHNDEMDSPLIYGDYYFLEALLRYKKLNN
jgi:chondroitin AC lyase